MSNDEEHASLLDPHRAWVNASGNYGTPCSSPISPVDPIESVSSRQRRMSIAAMAVVADIMSATPALLPGPPLSMESFEADEACKNSLKDDKIAHSPKEEGSNAKIMIQDITSQLPAIFVVSIMIFMLGIPFGAAFFPTELELPGKEIMGLRMFLFSTMMAQLVFTFSSKFTNCVGVQMVENVPFYLELARILIAEEGNGESASSTLFFLFGISSLIVGLSFYLLGRFELGRILYFFPKHVLVGCIGGIGLFIVVTALEVSTNTTFTFTAEGVNECIIQKFQLLLPVFAFEVVLRLLTSLTTKDGVAQYPLLGPIYYCFITPVFYAVLLCAGISLESAEEGGYFFPPLISSGSVFNKDLFRIFTEVNPHMISWTAVVKSIPTILGLTAFSLIHVPINIPAFAISTNVEPDMNAELIAHGYSNVIAGLFGGLQNYLAYSPSVVYSKSQGDGKRSSLSIVTITIAIFIYGPTIASYVPRCMAGTLLLHLGIDLFLEGGIDSHRDYDTLEYSGICLIMIVMVVFGMDQALLAGLVAALSTYVAQSIVYQDPIRGAMSGARLRSSAWNRSSEAQQILLDPKIGRGRIYVVELQGHIFFGNIVKLTEDIKQRLNQKRQAGDEPIVVILDFSDVLGVDSSAAQSIVKLKIFIQKNFNVKILLFVTGHEDGFLCSYDLSHKVVDELGRKSIHIVENKPLVKERRMSLAAGALANHVESQQNVIAEIPRSQVFETTDDALIFAEDVLIALEDPTIIQTDCHARFPLMHCTSDNIDEVNSILETIMPEASEDEIEIIANLLAPEKYQRGDIVWEQGDASDSLKVVVSGSLISLLEDVVVRNATESICPGAVIGELGLVNRNPRLTTVQVLSDDAILYSLSREKWQTLTEQQPKIARYIDMLVIRYLFHRIQHVSNNRSLPV